MRILVVDSLIWSPERVVGEGYVYIDSGRIVEVGEGYPPPERQAAETLIGGRGRLVIPSPVAPLFIPELYPVRHLLDNLGVLESRSLGEYLERRQAVSYHASLMALYELAVNGFGEAVLVAYNGVEVVKALRDSGLSGIVLVNACARGMEHVANVLKAMQQHRAPGRIGLGVLACEGDVESYEGVDAVAVVEGATVKLMVGGRVLSLDESLDPLALTRFPSPWPHMSRAFNKRYEHARRLLLVEGFRLLNNTVPLKPGSPATITVLDLTEPPSVMVVGANPLDMVSYSCPRVETVISRGSIIVDGGENLYVGSEAAERAREVLAKAYGELKTLV